MLEFTLHTTTGPALNGTQRSTVNDEYALAFRVEFLVALAFFGIAVVRVVWAFTGEQT